MAAILDRRSSVGSVAGESEAAAGLSDDMLAEIIRRLPVKSAARSKCVSKGWRATISDGYLRRRLPLQLSAVYLPDGPAARGGSAPRFACADAAAGGGLLEDRGLDFFPFQDGAVACDACNGLLLLRAAGTARFYVADPVTRRWAALPPPSRDARLSVLAFDPFAAGAPRFHVLNFTGRWRESGGEVEVFSSEAWAWAVRDAELGVPAASLSALSMHAHGGAVYALAMASESGPAAGHVVRMDVAGPDLACTLIDLPEPAGSGDGRLAHSNGRLHYVAGDGELLKVWVLDDELSPARQWRLKHAVRADDAVRRGGWCAGGETRFLALHPEKDAVYLWWPWKLVEYDLNQKAITGAWEFGKGEKNRVVKACLVPSSLYLSDSDCLADGRLQQC